MLSYFSHILCSLYSTCLGIVGFGSELSSRGGLMVGKGMKSWRRVCFQNSYCCYTLYICRSRKGWNRLVIIERVIKRSLWMSHRCECYIVEGVLLLTQLDYSKSWHFLRQTCWARDTLAYCPDSNNIYSLLERRKKHLLFQVVFLYVETSRGLGIS